VSSDARGHGTRGDDPPVGKVKAPRATRDTAVYGDGAAHGLDVAREVNTGHPGGPGRQATERVLSRNGGSQRSYPETSRGGEGLSPEAGATSWSAVNSGLTNTIVSALAIDPSAPTTLYAGSIREQSARTGACVVFPAVAGRYFAGTHF